MKLSIQNVTPAMAQEWLNNSKNVNRPLHASNVKKLATDMDEGRFKTTHEAVAKAKDTGFVIDGQHRLAAIVMHGKPVDILVAEDCDPESFDVIGSGRPRTASDLFAIQYRRENGAPASRVTLIAGVASGMLRGLKDISPNRNDIADHAIKHQALIAKLVKATDKVRALVPSAVLAAFANGILYFGEDKVLPIVNRLNHQKWSGDGDPARALYNRLLKDRLRSGQRGGNWTQRASKLYPTEKYGATLTAIRAELLGRSIQRCEVSTCDVGEAINDSRYANKKEV